MPSHHSSHHSSSHHSSSHHSSSIHHSTPTHHMNTTTGYRRSRLFVGSTGRFSPLRFVGCLIVPLLIILVPVFFIITTANSAVSSIASSFSASLPNSSISSDSNGGNLAADPTVVADLAVMNTALDKRIAQWEKQNDTAVHHLSTSEADLPANFNTKEVVYGHCSSGQFYTLVLNITPPEDTTADTEGYEYVSTGTPGSCAPNGWHMMTSDNVSPNWFWVTIDTHQATAIAGQPTAAPTNGG